MRIGLTGGIGCGKSTAAKAFERLGFGRIDCDEIAHELLASDNAVKKRIVQSFGPDVIATDGRVDRKALAGVVFADSKRLRELEEILHPRIREAWEAAIKSEPAHDWVVEIPLLFEKKLQNKVDFTVCVFSDLETQLDRLERNGINRDQALARIAQQLPVSEKAKKADFTLLNDGSLDFLDNQVQQLVSQLNKKH